MNKSYLHPFAALLVFTTASQASQLPEPEKASAAALPSSSLSQIAASHRDGGLPPQSLPERSIDTGRRYCPGHKIRSSWRSFNEGRIYHCEPGCQIVWQTVPQISLGYQVATEERLNKIIADRLQSGQEGGKK